MWRFVVAVLVLGGCESETWVYAPTADLDVDVDAGTVELGGLARLTYDAAELPDEVVSDALRLVVSSSIDERLVLEYPGADEADLGTFRSAAKLNLNGVYVDCGEPTCVTDVAFRVVRESDAPATLHISADAILSRPSVLHDVDADSDAATLELSVAR